MAAEYVVLGAHGQLGQAFCQVLRERGATYVALSREQADLEHFEDLSLPLSSARCLINCAAYTQVDAAEEHEATATRINGDAVGHLARLCAETGTDLVHFSTDYVFDGQATRPYPVDRAREPLNAYGRSKARGEELVEQLYPETLLIRTSWVYAPWGNNFVRTMSRLLREKEQLKVVHDQRGRPTHVLGLAERALLLLSKGCRGTYHVTDEGECSWYEFTQAIRDLIGSSCRLEPCTSDEFPRPAKRPAYSVLDISKTESAIGPARTYREWLEDCLADERT